MAKDKKDDKKKTKRPSALKRHEQSLKNQTRNRSFKATTKTAMKKLETVIASASKADVSEQLSNVYSLLDKGVKKGIYTANKAGRDKAKATRLASKAV